MRRNQAGFSALLAIAVLVLLGSVTAYAVGMVSSAQAGIGREIAHSRATLAARAGLDWGRFRVQAPALPQCSAAQSIATLPGTLGPYRVTVRCLAGAPRQEGAATRRAYQVSATACNVALAGQCPNTSTAAGADYVEHTVSAVVVR